MINRCDHLILYQDPEIKLATYRNNLPYTGHECGGCGTRPIIISGSSIHLTISGTFIHIGLFLCLPLKVE